MRPQFSFLPLFSLFLCKLRKVCGVGCYVQGPSAARGIAWQSAGGARGARRSCPPGGTDRAAPTAGTLICRKAHIWLDLVCFSPPVDPKKPNFRRLSSPLSSCLQLLSLQCLPFISRVGGIPRRFLWLFGRKGGLFPAFGGNRSSTSGDSPGGPGRFLCVVAQALEGKEAEARTINVAPFPHVVSPHPCIF